MAKNDAVSSKLSIQEKSTAFIQQQQREIEKLHAEKVRESKECAVPTMINVWQLSVYMALCQSKNFGTVCHILAKQVDDRFYSFVHFAGTL